MRLRLLDNTNLRRLLDNVLASGLSTNSGIYAGVDPELSMKINERGEYEYIGVDDHYRGPADKLLQVSAFGGVAPNEDEIAQALYGSQTGVQHDVIAGYFLGTSAGWVDEPGFRSGSSSGGVATWVLCELMKRGEIDGVVHLKEGGPEGQLFTYQVSRSVDEVRAGAKTRYYPGELSTVLREIRNVPGRYAVVGIPSFIYELRLLQRIEPVFRERIVYTIGLICGHQKSANYARYLAWRGGILPEMLRSIDFRKKIAQEPANQYSTEIVGLVDGVEEAKIISQKDLFGTDWGLGFFKSSFSDFTQDALNETADLALGDAWLPRYTPDGRGTNIIIARDSRLSDLLDEGRASGKLHLEQVPLNDVVRSQTSLIRQSVLEVPYRFGYLERAGVRTPSIRRTGLTVDLSLARRLIQRIRLVTSQASHSAYIDAAREGSLTSFDRQMIRLSQRYKFVQRVAKVQNLVSRGPRAVLGAMAKRSRL